MLYSINLPYAYFAIVVENDIVVKAAPIAKWALGKKIENVLDYYENKGAEITKVSCK